MDFPINKIQELLNEEWTIKDIAKYFNVSIPTMSAFLKKNNLFTKTQKQKQMIQKIDTQKVSEEYLSGATIKQLTQKYNVSNSVIKRILQETNVKTRNNSLSHTQYPCDQYYFDTIDSYNKAYLLGFICADGWTTERNEVGICVKKSDQDIITFFKKELKSNKPIYYKNGGTAIEVRIQNQNLCNRLKEYSIIPNKSLYLDIEKVISLANLDSKYIPAFLLGYFDGDGGIYEYAPSDKTPQYSCNITGTYETCTYYKKYFDEIGFFTKRHKDDKNNYTYQIGGRNQVKKCLSKLYSIKDNLDFYYIRKYKIFTKL